MIIQQEDDRNRDYSFEEEPEQNGEHDEEEYIQLYHANTHEENQTEDDSTQFLDIGATHHLAYRKDWLDNYQELPMPLKVTFGDNHKKVAVGRGNIKLKFIGNHMYKFQIYTLYLELQTIYYQWDNLVQHE